MGLRSFWHNQPCLCHNGPLEPCCGLLVWWSLGHSQLLGQFGPSDCCCGLFVSWPMGLGLPATVNTVCVKIVHQNLVVDSLYDDSYGSVSFCSNRPNILLRIDCVMLRSSCHSQPCLCQNGPSDYCCGLFVWWPIGHSGLFSSHSSITVVVSCLYDDPPGTVSFFIQIAPSDCCCGLFVSWPIGHSQLFGAIWSIRLLLRTVSMMIHGP